MTSLSLEAFSKVHWTATAFTVSSLMLGIFAVYASFLVHQKLNGFPSVERFGAWLFPRVTQEISKGVIQQIPSIPAVIVVTMPSELLNLSLKSLGIGLSIYFLCVSTDNLIDGLGSTGALYVFFFYTLSVLIGFFFGVSVIPTFHLEFYYE